MAYVKYYRIPREDGTKVEAPVYSTEGAACMDLFAANTEDIVIKQKEVAFIPSGLKVEIEPGYCMKLQNRSSMGAKNQIQLAHCTGIVDSDYRGEILIPLYNRGNRAFVVTPGMKICQAEITEVIPVDLEEVEAETDLSVTERGEGGFGSTGA
jgi:dUTP pyrophosphatase